MEAERFSHMKIRKKAIRSVESYISDFEDGARFCIAFRIDDNCQQILDNYGFTLDGGNQQAIPRPLKKVSKQNAEGDWLIHRDQPKESRIFEKYYHVVDWHGKDHYGICYQERQCYPRTRIPPIGIELILEGRSIRTPIFENVTSEHYKIKHSINLLLEMFGECETLTEQLTPITSEIPVKTVPWTILPIGEWPRDTIPDKVRDVLNTAPNRHRPVISSRHTEIRSFEPTECYLGDAGFMGYIVYAFPEKNLYVFESNNIDNATYVFNGNWNDASQLTKYEIICGGLHEARLIHTDSWKSRLKMLLR